MLLTYLQPRLTLTALGVAPLVVGSALVFGRRLRRITTGVQDRVAEATAVAEEAFSQIRTVQSFVQEPAERARYGERIAASVRTALQRAKVRGRLLRRAHLLDLRRHRLRALAGRPAGAGRQAHRGRRWSRSSCIPSPSRPRSARWPRSSAPIRRRSARRSGCSRSWRCVPTIADPAEPETLATPVRGRVEFEDVSFRYAQGDGDLDPRGRHAPRGSRRGGRAGGAVGRRQDHPGLAAAPLLGRGPGPDPARRPSTCGHSGWRTSAGAIGIVPQEPALFSGIGAGEHRLRPARRLGRRSRSRGPRGPRARVHRAAAPGVRHPGRASGGSSSQAASGSGWRSPGRFSRTRRCWSWTRRPATSTPRASG